MPTNGERREVAARLREARANLESIPVPRGIEQASFVYLGLLSQAVHGGDLFNRLADLIEPEPERTCRFIPDYIATVYDEDDNEVDTEEPSEDCCAFECTECGGAMIYGDMGWFDTEPPYKPHFEYCPYCGAKVVENG